MVDNRLGIVVRMDRTGLGYQTRNLVQMLKPDYLMILDSRSHFDKQVQHPEWYDGFQSMTTRKLIPTIQECRMFLDNVGSFITCETPYNWYLMTLANQMLKKSYIQYNYEFLDYLQNKRLPLPTKFLSPSYWKLKEVKDLFGNRVEYLPPPLFLNDFKEARKTNLNRSGRRKFLHVVGKQAIHDRNGTDLLLKALKHTNADFELVIKSQFDMVFDCNDPRVTFSIGNAERNEDLYKDFDAMILPRRYGGLCLPMNEALASGLPVMMSQVSPNTKALPIKWLIRSGQTMTFQTRAQITVYDADIVSIARRIERFVEMSDTELDAEKVEAFNIAYNNYSTTALQPKYEALLCG